MDAVDSWASIWALIFIPEIWDEFLSFFEAWRLTLHISLLKVANCEYLLESTALKLVSRPLAYILSVKSKLSCVVPFSRKLLKWRQAAEDRPRIFLSNSASETAALSGYSIFSRLYWEQDLSSAHEDIGSLFTFIFGMRVRIFFSRLAFVRWVNLQRSCWSKSSFSHLVFATKHFR